MFYLYIDEVLISSYHNFSEVRDFIFDFYYDLVKDYLGDDYFMDLEEFCHNMDRRMDYVILGLCRHNYQYFNYLGHEVQVHYGYREE